jgi:choline dehydrogenase-like flavoprotein
MADEPVDVLIVGAGAAGAAFAWSLAETRMNILCLEQGDWMNPAEYPTTGLDWEARGHGDFALSPNVRQRPADYPVNDADSPISISNFNAVGGSTILYAGHFPRLKPSDFRVRSLDGVADDWPLDYAALEPYWAENDRVMGVAGLAGDPAYPPKEPVLPPVPLGVLGETVARGFNALGWHWWPSDSAIATEPHEGRAACINLGPCITGCAQGAKGSTDVTYWPAALRRGVRLETRCRVREITLRSDGMADGVTYHDASGTLRHQRAEIVVLACNGVGTPRLLLNSRSREFPDGLANRSGLVGRNLMLHPYAMALGIFDERLDGHRGPTGCGLMSHEFYETDPARGFVRGFSFELLRGFGPLATALFGMTTGQVPWGERHHRAYGELLDHSAGLLAICEDLPEEHNAVTLDPELVDGHGIPAPRIAYRLSENSRRMLDYGATRAREALEAAGARRTFVEAPLRIAGWHLMGTARMGTDPERSVVNAWGRSHDVRNLFIIDGSLFVTAGAVNPTCTIQALALHVADRIKKNLGNLFD